MRAVNLIPHEIRRGAGGRAGRSGGLVYVLLGGLTVLVAMVALWAMAGRDAGSARTELAQLQQRNAEAQRRAAPLAAFQALATQGQQQITLVKTLADTRFPWSDTMGALARILPRSVRISNLTGALLPAAAVAPAVPPATTGAASPVPAPAAIAVSVPTITIAGCAPTLASVAKLVPRMTIVPGVADVTLGPATAPSEKSDAAAGSSDGACHAASFEMLLSFAPEAPTAPTAATTTQALAPGVSG